MMSGMMVDEIVWDDCVASVTNDMMYTIAPITMSIKNNNTFFTVQISPLLRLFIRFNHGLSQQYLFSSNNKDWRGTAAMHDSG
jgi:hypothetical protein